MSDYSGPPKDRPETTFSGYANGLRAIAGLCAFFAVLFLIVGIKEFIRPEKMDAARMYATLGIGCALALTAAACVRGLQTEWKEVSSLYIEFKDKQLRNTLVDKEIFFLAQDIVDAVFLERSDREEALSKLNLQRGKRMLDRRLFVNANAIDEVFAKRNDRSSILLMRAMRTLPSSKGK
jgi:hypothetical protein